MTIDDRSVLNDNPLMRRFGRLGLVSVLATSVLACGENDDDGGADTGGTSPLMTGGADTGGDTDTDTGTDTGPGGDTDTDTDTGVGACDPDVIPLPGDMLYPEGIAIAEDGTIYVGSLGSGDILQITPTDCASEDDAHLVETFYESDDDDPVGSTVGMIVDEDREVLWACTSDPTGTNGTAAALLGFSLGSGELVATHELGNENFCNDVAVDDDGNLYATDSFQPQVVRVVAADAISDEPAEPMWSTGPDFVFGPGQFGLNGITWDGSDLYVVVTQAGTMFRINPDDGDEDELDLDTTLTGADGIKSLGGDAFVVAGNNALVRVEVDGTDATTEVLEDALVGPTTVQPVDDDMAWVVQGQVGGLFGGPAPQLPFTLVRVSTVAAD